MRITRHTMTMAGLILLPLLISSCTQSPAGPSGGLTNLIGNSDFQAADTASLQGWITGGAAQIVTEPPPSDGQYSLQLQPGWAGIVTYARTYVTGQMGIGVYKLSIWEKSFDNFNGTISIGLWRQGSFVQKKSYTSSDSVWQMIYIVDTLSTQPEDSIAVELYAGWDETVKVDWRALFGSVELERVQ